MVKRLKKILEFFSQRTGIYFVKYPKHHGRTKFVIDQYSYEPVWSLTQYAPWSDDPEFLKTFNAIRSNTLVDFYRCYELWELTEEMHHLDPTAHFIEIGVWRGGTAAIVGQKLSLLKSDVNFYLGDTFTGVKKSSDKDGHYFDGEHADTSQEIVSTLIESKTSFKNYRFLKGIFPEETAHLVSMDAKFGFCHIDVDVYNSARDIVDWIWDKMIIGGVIVFDDYGFHTCNGITRYVNEQRRKSDRMIVYNLNGHAIMVKIK